MKAMGIESDSEMVQWVGSEPAEIVDYLAHSLADPIKSMMSSQLQALRHIDNKMSNMDKGPSNNFFCRRSSSPEDEVRDDLELVLRVGSMFEASQRTFPYVFLAGVYDLSVKLDNGPLSTSESKDLFGYGAGVGIRSFAGEHGFYDFSYMYHQASETSLGTYSADSSKANFEMDRGVFTAAIGYMF